MITEQIKHFIESTSCIFIATADSVGQPHMAIGEQVAVSGDTLTFENWFCPDTLQNILENSKVSVVAVLPATGRGFQLIGTVISVSDSAFQEGYDPTVYTPETPNYLTRFSIRVDKVLEFTSGIHSDLSI